MLLGKKVPITALSKLGKVIKGKLVRGKKMYIVRQLVLGRELGGRGGVRGAGRPSTRWSRTMKGPMDGY